MKYLFAAIAMIVAIGILGCSSQDRSPLFPSNNSNPGIFNLAVSDYFPDGTPAGGAGILGLFEVHVDKITDTAEIVPIRASSMVDVLEVVDITGFMTNSPCSDCVRIEAAGIDFDGNVVLHIGIRHPFEAGDIMKPVSGRNRADLHVFNVEGIVVLEDGGSVLNFPGLNQKLSPYGLVNADGYSSYLDAYFDQVVNTNSTLHPYILHFDDYGQGNFSASNPMGFSSVTIPSPSGNLVMPMGSGYSFRDYQVATGSGSTLDFYFAVGCTYGITTSTFENRFTPEYRVPQHNKKAASKVVVEVAENNLVAGIPASKAKLNVKVLDINHGVSVGSALNQMFADSSVGKIVVEVPGVTSVPDEAVNPVSVSGNGRDPSNPLLFQVEFKNTASGAAGSYNGLVKVVDSYPVGSNTHPFIGLNDGAKRVPPTSSPLTGLFQIPEFATYQVFKVSVGTETVNPIVTINADPPSGNAPLEVQFTIDVILATGATIDNISWTFGDGGISASQNPIYTYTNPGLWTAKCVVTDSFMNSGDDTFIINVTNPDPEYIGSNACNSCHSANYSTWSKHGHSHILNTAVGAPPSFPYSSIPNPPSGLAWNQITYVAGGFGFKANFLNSDGYVITGPDVQYNLKNSQFVQYESPTRGMKDYDCGMCHSTGWVSFANNGGVHQGNLPGIMGTWAEPNVGCEACHGKGSLHAIDPPAHDMTADNTSALCGQCHKRETTNKVYAGSDNLCLDEQQYNELLASPHSAKSCNECHDRHASTIYDSQAPGTGLIANCTDCHAASTHQVGHGMSSLKCTDCHMPMGAKSATSSNDGTVHVTGDLHSHIWAIDTTGITLGNYFSTDGTDKWITPDAFGKVKLNLAYACMQCHDGVRESSITSYTVARGIAQGIHN
jgi:PKD repeat protein